MLRVVVVALAAGVGLSSDEAQPERSAGHIARLGKRIVHSPPRSRFLQTHASDSNGSSIPADGAIWPTAIYWSMVEIGMPPQSFPVAIDSGSGDLDVAGVGCDGCVTAPPNNQYDPDASSSSARAFPRTFSNTYQTCDLTDPTAPCTISGSVYTDQVSLAGYGPVEVKLGAITAQTSNFDQFKEIDGVMGFTGGGSEDVFSQLVAAGACPDVWALCLHDGAVSNGTLTVGGVDARLAVGGAIDYVEDVGRGFHSVAVANILVGGASRDGGAVAGDEPDATVIAVPSASSSAILDTGTNVLLLPASLIAATRAAMCDGADAALDAATCGALWNGTCVALSEAEVDAFPSLALELADGGLRLEMTSRDYLLLGSPLAAAAGQYCIGIKDGGSAGGSGFIIGDTTMRHYYLVFDNEQGRIGWGPVNTETCGSV